LKGDALEKNKTHILGWIGALLVLYGYFLNANQEAGCWLVWIVGNIFVGWYCVTKKAWPTALMSFVLVILNIYGYVSWVS
tara:strand:+ start:690 stop:929 length:240 start_codon:yes stop_codon:yes gene_type:complete